MPPFSQVQNVIVRGTARVLRIETKELEIDGRTFSKADIVSILNRIQQLESRVTALGG